MNGSTSPGPTTRSSAAGDVKDDAPSTANGDTSELSTGEKNGQSSPVPSIEGNDGQLADTLVTDATDAPDAINGADEDAASEAETLIDSPVKRREAEKRQQAMAAAKSAANTGSKHEKPQRSRIGSLPVPQEDDDDMDSAASPMQSTEIAGGAATSTHDAKDDDIDMLDDDADAEGSDVLSSARSSARESPMSSPSRAESESPQASRKDDSPPNPRKRKHRASSVENYPTKRRSIDPPTRRKLRGGMHGEDRSKADRSPSPKARGHRRAISTQSAIDSGMGERAGRKRRGSQFPTREPKPARGWEESDASSETTTRGNDDYKRPQRGVGRSTSTPGGRFPGREHKRHVNKYGFTKLAEACEDGDLDLVKELREKDPESLEVAEFAGNKPLQIAALNGNAEVVAYLIGEGALVDCANVDKDTPLIDAAENGHLDVVRLLLNAGVDPMRQNNKGQQALDVVTDETEDATGIRSALHAAIEDWTSSTAKERREEQEERHSRPPGVTSKELHFMARTYDNLLKLVQNNDRTGVQEFLAARVPVDNVIIAAAAKTGDVYLVNMLLAEMTEKKLTQKAEKPMLAVLGSSHFEMVKVLTEMEWFDPLWTDRQGRTWADLAEEKQGPMWRQEKDLFARLSGRASSAGTARRSSSPVTKREPGTRRKLANQQAIEEESDDDDNDTAGANAAKKKTPRRLMSKKNMRTAKGAGNAVSDDSEDGSSEEDAPGEPDETNMKPPDTPSTGTRRHLRSKSQSGSPEMSTKTLRRNRSTSIRSAAGATMPTLNEEENNATPSMDGVEQVADTISVEVGKKSHDEEPQASLDMAAQAEQKKQEEETAEADAKKAQAEIERKNRDEKRLEDEKNAEEARKAEAIRQVEEARKEEEERQELRKAQEEEKLRYRADVLSALPPAIATALHPDTPSIKFDDTVAQCWFEQYFTPLRILPTKDRQHWVLNLQAAPLLGPSGLELFYSSEYLDYDNCRAAQWTTSDVADRDVVEVDRLLTELPSTFAADDELAHDSEAASFDEDLRRAAGRYNAYMDAYRKITSPTCKAKLRRVRLQDIVDNLHPAIQRTRLQIHFAEPPIRQKEEVLKQLEIQGTQDFVGRMKVFWEDSRGPRAVSAGQDFVASAVATDGGQGHVKFTEAVIRQEK